MNFFVAFKSYYSIICKDKRSKLVEQTGLLGESLHI